MTMGRTHRARRNRAGLLLAGIACIFLLSPSIARAANSPTGRNPKVQWTPQRQDVWNQMVAENHQWWQDVKSWADATGTPNERYADNGRYATIAYQWTGDVTYARKAWDRIQPALQSMLPWWQSRNGTRDEFIQWVWMYDWLYPALSQSERDYFISYLNHLGDLCLDRVPGTSWGTRPGDSDECTGQYFGLALLDIATAPDNPRAGTFLNNTVLSSGVPVGGLDATAVDMSTLRNSISYFIQKAAGGDWIESCEYNMGTVEYLMSGVDGLYTATGTEHFPEVRAWLPQLAFHEIAKTSSNFIVNQQYFQWGDVERPHYIYTNEFITTLGMVEAMLRPDTTIAPYAKQFCNEFRTQVGTSGGRPDPRFYVVCSPYTSTADWRNVLAKSLACTGQGTVQVRDGWDAPASLFCAHMPNLTGVDHEVAYMGDVQLLRKQEWALTHCLTYGAPIGVNHNTMQVCGLQASAELRRMAAYEVGASNEYTYTAGVTGGQYVYNGYYDPPPIFMDEWTRELLYLPSTNRLSDTIVIFDRVSARDPRDLPKFDRYYQPERDAVTAADGKKEWYIHMPVSPTVNSGSISWQTAGGQNVRVDTLLPSSNTKEIMNEAVVGVPGTHDPSEEKWHVRMTPTTKQEWDTFLNVFQAYDGSNVATVTLIQASAGEAQGMLMTNRAGGDVLAMFNSHWAGRLTGTPYDGTNAAALNVARLFQTGYTFSWTCSTSPTSLYLMDLDPNSAWYYKLNGGAQTALTVSANGMARLSITGTGARTVEVIKGGGATLAITTTSLATDTVGIAYNQTLQATGGTSPYTWAVSSGSLPAGLSLVASTGAITGTPTASGTSNFTARVTDNAAATATKALSIVVNPAPSITTSSLPGGQTGTAYSQTLAATGGTTPLIWSIQAGNLPAGLSLVGGTGAITGTPTTAGTSNFTVKVTDNVGASATKALSIAISAGALSITTASLPNGTLNASYSQTLAATGGQTPYSWSVSNGSLPAGLSLGTSTGVISGTPTASGTSNFTARVTDNLSATATKALSIAVLATQATTFQDGLNGYSGATDTWLNSDYPDDNNGAVASAHLQYATQDRQLHRFDVSSIPAGATVNSATIYFYAYNVTGGTPTVGCYRVLTHWDEMQATYNSRLTGTLWGAAGLQSGTDYNATAIGTATVSAAGWVSFDITSTVQGWVSGSYVNEGVMYRETAAGHIYTYMREYTIDASLRPKLVVNYTAPGITITTASLPGGTVGAAYSQTLAASGGSTPYTWSIQSGSLPGGLSLVGATGVISGTPTASGTSSFTAKVTDSVSATATKALSIMVTAAGNTYYVATTGNDGWPGTSGQPWATLQHAADTAVAGDTVLVASGNYAGFRVVDKSGSAGSPITFRSQTQGGANINSLGPSQAHGSMIELEGSSANIQYWVIDAFSIDGTVQTAGYGVDVRGSDHVTVQNCTVHNAFKTGIFAAFSDYYIVQNCTSHNNGEHGIYNSNSSDYGVVRGNYVYSNASFGVHTNGDYTMGGDGVISNWLLEKNNSSNNVTGLNFDQVETTVVRNNLIYNFSGKGFSLYGSGTGVGSRNNRILNNTALSKTDGSSYYTFLILGGSGPAPVGNKVFNNILYHYSTANNRGSLCIATSAETNFESDYNVVMNYFGLDDAAQILTLAQWRSLGYDVHSIQATDTALFVNPAANDYHLKAGSPAINAGTALADVADDYEGNSRPQGGAYDIGCYEASGGTALSITTTSLPADTVNVAYNQTLQATGGTMPYTWAIASGSLPAGLSLVASTGAITGTPTAAGTSNFTARVTDNVSATATQALSIVINAAPSITTSSLPADTVNVAYNQTLAAAGGTSPLTWAISSGSLPTGLSIVAGTGAITGTPTASGTSSFTARVTDNVGATATKALSIVVNAAPSITTSSLPNGSVGVAYNQTMAATGGTSPLTWAISSGSLPAGLSLVASTGAVTGTPTTSGTSSFTARVTDNVGATATKALSIIVTQTLTITTSSLPATTVGATYNQTLAATGGTTPYTWAISSGTLPAGLSLVAGTGAITGTPTAAGTSNFTARVTDNVSATATAALSIVVNAAISITTSSLPADTVNIAYSQTLAATGGTGSLTWSLNAGSLPTGLSLTAGGVTSGTPTASGTSNFTVKATDSVSASATKALSIVISAAPSITTTSLPNGTVNSAYNQTLAATGGTTPLTWAISSGSLPAGLSLAASTGVISGTPTASGTSNFTTRVTDNVGATATKALSIVVNAGGPVNVTLQDGLNGYAGTTDTWLNSDYPTTNFGNDIQDHLQYTTQDRQLHRFDVSSIPSSATVNSATIYFYVYSVTGGTPAVGCYRVLTHWDELQATYNNRLTGTAWGSAGMLSGTDYVATAIGTFTVSAAGWVSYDVTSTVQGWVNGSYANEGVMYRETSTGHCYTRMSEYATDTSLRPKLAVTYTASPGAPTITTSSLPADTVGIAYNQTLQATGGTAPYTWAVLSGSLPTGLSLNTSTGAITGTPTTAGTSSFTAKVTDNAAATASKALSIVINAAVSITTSSLPADTAGIAYNQTLSATGGTGGLTWSLNAGSLPAGLSLASGGSITGTPTAAGTSNFTVKATDTVTASATKALSIVVNAAISITTSSLPADTVSVAYNQTLSATGGTGALSWSVSSGALPTGLSLNSSTGAITGTPSSAGTANFTVTAADTLSATGTKALSIVINAVPSITTSSLPGGTVGAAYNQTLASTGGTSPVTWSLQSGSLPAGLSLAGSTGAITGTPTASGTSNFTAKVTDNVSASATKALSIAVSGGSGDPTYWQASSDTVSQTTGTAYTNKVTLTFTPTASDDYLIVAYAEHSVTGYGSHTARLTVDGVVEGEQQRRTRINDYYPFSIVKAATLSAASHTIAIDFASIDGGTASIRNARIVALRKASLEWFQAAADTQVSLTTTATDFVTMNFTPSTAGDYLLIWHAEPHGRSGMDAVTRSRLDGVTVHETDIQGGGSDPEATPHATFTVATLTAAQHTMTVQAYTSNGTGLWIRRCRVAAIRLTGGRLANYAYQADDTESTTTSTAYVQKLSRTWTSGSNGNWLALMSSSGSQTATYTACDVEVKYNGSTVVSNNVHAVQNTSEYMPTTGIGVFNVVAGGRTMAVNYRSGSASSSPKIKFVHLALLPLDDGAPAEPTYQFAASDSEATSTSTNYVNKATLSFTPGVSDTWVVMGFAELKNSSTSRLTSAQLTIDGAVAQDTTLAPKNATDYQSFVGMKVVTLSAAAHTINIAYKTSASAGTAYIRYARIVAIRQASLLVSSADEGDTGHDVTTTMTDYVTTSFTPATAGDYLLIWSAAMNGNTTSYNTNIEARLNGTAQDTCSVRNNNTSNYVTFLSVQMANLAASAQTISLAAAKDSGSSAVHHVKRSRVTAIRLSGSRFTGYQSNAANTESTTTSTTFQNKLTQSWTPAAAGNWLVLTSFRTTNSSTSYSTEGQVTVDDSTTSAQPLKRIQATTDYLPMGSVDVRNLTAASHHMDVNYRSASTSGTAKIKYVRFVGLPL